MRRLARSDAPAAVAVVAGLCLSGWMVWSGGAGELGWPDRLVGVAASPEGPPFAEAIDGAETRAPRGGEPGGKVRRSARGEGAGTRTADDADLRASARVGALGLHDRVGRLPARPSDTDDSSARGLPHWYPAEEPTPESPDVLAWLDVARDPSGVLAHARGRDLAAPRALTLWRVDVATQRAAVLARTVSRADQSFAFERLLASPREVHLVVSAQSHTLEAFRGWSPAEPGAASAIATLKPARLPPPEAILDFVEDDGATWQLRLHAVPGAALHFDDTEGASRHPGQAPVRLAGQPHPTLRVTAPRGEHLLISQQTADGRASSWVSVESRPQFVQDAAVLQRDSPERPGPSHQPESFEVLQ